MQVRLEQPPQVEDFMPETDHRFEVLAREKLEMQLCMRP